jgi:hypothetical protein
MADDSLVDDSMIHGGGGNGLGNLADELGGDWSEGDEEEEEDSFYEDGELEQFAQQTQNENIPIDGKARDNSIEASSSPGQKTLQPIVPQHSRRRSDESQYDGSDYGDDSDLEPADGISKNMDAKMALVEGLARRGTEANGSESDGVIKRVATDLRELGGQSNVEANASRFVSLCRHHLLALIILQTYNSPHSPLNTPCKSNPHNPLPHLPSNIPSGVPVISRPRPY